MIHVYVFIYINIFVFFLLLFILVCVHYVIKIIYWPIFLIPFHKIFTALFPNFSVPNPSISSGILRPQSITQYLHQTCTYWIYYLKAWLYVLFFRTIIFLFFLLLSSSTIYLNSNSEQSLHLAYYNSYFFRLYICFDIISLTHRERSEREQTEEVRVKHTDKPKDKQKGVIKSRESSIKKREINWLDYDPISLLIIYHFSNIMQEIAAKTQDDERSHHPRLSAQVCRCCRPSTKTVQKVDLNWSLPFGRRK